MAPLAPIAIAATAAAGVVGAIGASQAASAAKATGIANQKGFERAAKVIEQQQEVVDAQFSNQVFQFNRTFKQNQANTEVLYLKSGVDLDGTPEDVLAENARNAQYELNIMDYNNKLAKKKLDDDATMMRYRGEIAFAEGQNLASSYKYKAFGSVLSGIGGSAKLAGTYYPSLLTGGSSA
jgi:isopentenyl diphosphate isomerase/L-lactate dehydrogenase-like FMN-dependent dehydrogenase